MFILAQKKNWKLQCTTTTAVSPNHYWKQHSVWMNNDYSQQEQRVRQQHSTDSFKALNDGISTRRYVCHSLWGPYLLTTKYHNDNMKCPTTLTAIIYQVPRNYCCKEYQVPGIKRKKAGKERRKRKMKKKKNMHALREQAESGWDKVAVCRWYGQSYDVSSWWTAGEGQKKARRTHPGWGQRHSRKKQE